MKISIIVPIYKGENYIQPVYDMVKKNLEVLDSTHTLELIYINDYPDIDISEKVNTLSKSEFLSVKLVNNDKNSGIHFSRVQGLKNATGEYIMFFDQDDTITDNYFASQIKHLKKNTDVLIANGIAQFPDYEKLLYRYYLMQWTAKHIWFYAKFDCRVISPGQCLIKKASIPIEWYDNIMKQNGADDYFLWLMMLTKDAKFSINRDRLYTHVYTANNTSLDNDKMYSSVDELIDINKNIHAIDDKAIAHIIARNSSDHKKSALVKLVEKMNRKGKK